MPYASQPMSIEFWTRLESRLATHYNVQRARLTEAMQPIQVTVDTGGPALQQSVESRKAVFSQIRELENIQLLLMILSGQVRFVSFQAEIPDLHAHIQCLKQTAEVLDSVLTNLPFRRPREQELNTLLTDYTALRNLGTGEVTMQERSRLRAITIQLPIVGAEDAAADERTLRVLQSSIDEKEAELQNLMVTTKFSLRVPDELASLVMSFGVTMVEEQPAAPMVATPTEQPEQA